MHLPSEQRVALAAGHVGVNTTSTAAASTALLPTHGELADAEFFVVLNGASGHHEGETPQQAIEGVLRAAGRKYRFYVVEDVKRLAAAAREAVAAARVCDGVVVAAGGDGTINTVIQACLGSGCRFGVVPQGTFNYFGRAHGVPADAAEATQALLSASVEPVQVGLVNDRVFIVNASVGLYPQLLEDREAYKTRFGRSRGVAMWAGLVTLLRGHQQLPLRIGDAPNSRTVRTPTLFVGNNRLQLESIGIAEAAAVDIGKLVAIILRPVGTLSLLWVTLRGALGQLGEAGDVDSFSFDRMSIKPRRRRVKVATDGEVAWMQTPLEFRVAPQPLELLVPAALPEEATADPAP